jgi:hypothetical protein
VLVSGSSKRIAILLHANDRDANRHRYVVDDLADCWREDGHEVEYLQGIDTSATADVLFVHVNLSVVPDEYLAFASRFPIVLNGQLRDIRKSVVSGHLVRPDDGWPGPVIVKSNANYGGGPERRLAPSWRNTRSGFWYQARRIRRRLTHRVDVEDWVGYRIYQRTADVPRSCFARPDLVVERFLPEVADGLFHVRVFQVLGDRWSCTRLASPEPIFKASMSVSSVPTDPHPEVQAWRRRFHVDYGKLDYVVHEGTPILLDVNKTTGASAKVADLNLKTMRRQLAEGLYSYFRDGTAGTTTNQV